MYTPGKETGSQSKIANDSLMSILFVVIPGACLNGETYQDLRK